MIIRNPKPWNHASPSQVKTARRCLRCWWLEKIAGLKRASSPAAELGGRVHNVAERWLLGELEIPKLRGERLQGEDGEALRIFAPGRKFLPQPPVPAGQVEQWVGRPGVCKPWKYNPEGCALPTPIVPLVGRVDLQLVEGGWRVVLDHKTTSAEKWAMVEEQLLEDVQAATYTREPVVEFGHAGFRHLYYLTKGRPQSWLVEVEIDRGRSDRLFAGVVDSLASMNAASTEVDAGKIPPNKTACRDYGGCPYRGRCSQIDGRRFEGMGNNSSGDGFSLADRIAGRAPPAAEPEPEPAAAPAATPGQATSLSSRLGKPGAAPAAPAATPAPTTAAPAASSLTSKLGRQPGGLPNAETAAERVRQEAQLAALERNREAKRVADELTKPATEPAEPNPPDGTAPGVVGKLGKGSTRGLQLPDGTPLSKAKLADLLVFLEIDKSLKPAEIAAHFGVELDARTKSALCKELAIAVLTGDLDMPCRPMAEAEAEPQPNESPASTPASTSPDPGPAPVTPSAPAVGDEEPVGPGFGILIDCLPVGAFPGRVVRVEELVAPLVAIVEEDASTLYYALPDYRKGQRLLAELVAQAAEASELGLEPGDAVLIPSSHPAAAELIDVLSRSAAYVLRGVSS